MNDGNITMETDRMKGEYGDGVRMECWLSPEESVVVRQPPQRRGQAPPAPTHALVLKYESQLNFDWVENLKYYDHVRICTQITDSFKMKLQEQ